jgi:hypothetical protein
MGTEAGWAAMIAPLETNDAARNQCGDKVDNDLNGVGIPKHGETILLRNRLFANTPDLMRYVQHVSTMAALS